MSVTQALAKEILSTSFEDVPRPAINRLKRLFVDHVGITYMGHRATGQALTAYAKEVSGRPEALLIGTKDRVSCEIAAAVNAQVCRNTDFEDSGPGLHPGPLITHTAHAVAQRVGCSGKDMLTAMAIGHDLNCRFFAASKAGPDIRHNNMVAAAIAARLLGFDQEQVGRALSVAWEFPIKSINYTGPKVDKRITALGMGNIFSVRAGLQAALMTAHGFESVPDEIDQMGDQYDLDKLVDHSARFEETQRNLFLKPWPTSHMCHMVVQSIEELVDENDLQPDDIISIKAGLPNVYLMPHQNNPHPARYWEAIYSTAWAFAMAVHRVPSGPDWFTDERIADAVCHATADKVEIVEDAAATAAYQALDLPAVDGWVEIKSTKGDLARSRTLNDTWGSPATPMPDDIFHGKFMRVTEPSLGTVGAQTLYDALQDIENCGAVSDISALM